MSNEPNRNPPWCDTSRFVVIKDPISEEYHVTLRERDKNNESFQPIPFKNKSLADKFCDELNKKS